MSSSQGDATPAAWRVQWDCQLSGLRDLNQSVPAVRAEALHWLDWYQAQFGFQGLRIDAMGHVPAVRGWPETLNPRRCLDWYQAQSGFQKPARQRHGPRACRAHGLKPWTLKSARADARRSLASGPCALLPWATGLVTREIQPYVRMFPTPQQRVTCSSAPLFMPGPVPFWLPAPRMCLCCARWPRPRRVSGSACGWCA